MKWIPSLAFVLLASFNVFAADTYGGITQCGGVYDGCVIVDNQFNAILPWNAGANGLQGGECVQVIGALRDANNRLSGGRVRVLARDYTQTPACANIDPNNF